MTSPQQILAILEDRRRELGLSQADVGMRAFGKQDNSAFQALRRGSSPAADKLAALSEALGLEFYFGPPRDDRAAVGDGPTAGDYARIPLHDVELAAGLGKSNVSEEIVDRLAFRRSWLKKIGVSPRNARLAHVRGDSMEPVLKDGDIVLIDVGRRSIPARPRRPGKPPRADLYAVLDGGEARIKRVEHSNPGRLILHSDNHVLYPPEIRDGANADDLGIIGKVVWWGHTVKE